MFKKFDKITKENGVTFVEIIVVTLIFLIAFAGVLLSFIKFMELSELSRNSSLAISVTNSRMEQIKNTMFSLIPSTYHNISFTSTFIDGRGVSYITTVNPQLYYVTISFCWRQKRGRVIGEDQNLNGVLDSGEDLNGNGIIDSPVKIVSGIYDL